MTNVFDVAVIGGGPAGLTAAIYALRGGKSTILLEATAIGGQAAQTAQIENYPGVPNANGFDLTYRMFLQAKEFGLQIRFEKVQKVQGGRIKTLKTSSGEVQARAVILAMGAAAKKLSAAVPFEGKGVSYCATCDGNFYRGKTVAVVGGGNTAVTDALYLADIAKKVYLVHRREELRASDVLVQKMKENPQITFLPGYELDRCEGKEHLERITLKQTQTEKMWSLPISGLFVAVGQIPLSDCVAECLPLQNGYVPADGTMQTAEPGIFAAGDVRVTPLRQVVTACADGAIAAESALAYLRREE